MNKKKEMIEKKAMEKMKDIAAYRGDRALESTISYDEAKVSKGHNPNNCTTLSYKKDTK